MKKIIIASFFLFLASFVSSPNVFAKIGVGVGTGKIQVEDKLKPGMIYEFPSLTVFNTGDEPSDYEIAITYHQDQPQFQPLQKWFNFSPARFHLKPGEAQTVGIKLNLPLRTAPGDYFAYLEGHPVKKSESGQTSIGIAAAAKLYFTVVPANMVLGAYYRLVSFWQVYAPWPKVGVIVLLIFIAVILIKKHFKINIDIAKKKSVREDE